MLLEYRKLVCLKMSELPLLPVRILFYDALLAICGRGKVLRISGGEVLIPPRNGMGFGKFVIAGNETIYARDET
ncbi:hypothetical protein [Phyllobacterium zundukense]|uniref:hypothetical protein n=1 Tax=Phyllobacterium zundukense TaxID=1867719 RepID=UPI0021C9A484|nr:hypothetical protein [Phyllobacterium zundukense]